MRRTSLKGIIPATVLPLGPEYDIDVEQLRAYIQWLLGHDGIGGLAVNVDTGEGPHLDREERLRVLEVYREEVKGKVPIVAGVIARYTAEALELARDVERAGADAAMVFPISAFFGEPLPPELPYRYHRAIAEAVDLPLVLFQLQPALGGVNYGRECLEALVKIDKVIAIKDASSDAKRFLDTFRVIKGVREDLAVLTGNDTFILESLILGADGALIGFGTIAIDLQVEMFKAVKRRDYEEAFAIWRRLLPLVEAIFAPPARDYRARLKEALVMLRVLKEARVRPPLLPISEAERKRIEAALRTAGLLG